jgi:hypothetical protein
VDNPQQSPQLLGWELAGAIPKECLYQVATPLEEYVTDGHLLANRGEAYFLEWRRLQRSYQRVTHRARRCFRLAGGFLHPRRRQMQGMQEDILGAFKCATFHPFENEGFELWRLNLNGHGKIPSAYHLEQCDFTTLAAGSEPVARFKAEAQSAIRLGAERLSADRSLVASGNPFRLASSG